MKKIQAFFYFLFNLKKINLFKKVNKKLYKTIEDREVDRIILKGQIIKMTRKFLRIDANSKFIPKDYRNTTEIRERILGEFGEQMNLLGVRINSKLEFV
jgi:RNase P/RNase MRP subunit p29